MTNLLCVVVNSLMRRFSEQTVHVSLLFNYFREIHFLFDMVDDLNAVDVCALGRNDAKVIFFTSLCHECECV
jgi:hypothetical protein